jgi:hypothetical protein
MSAFAEINSSTNAASHRIAARARARAFLHFQKKMSYHMRRNKQLREKA